MNQELSLIFGEAYVRIPLKKSPNIHVGNALTTDWREIVSPDECSYILGNPPFAGKSLQSKEQRAEIDAVFAGKTKSGILDYVAGWYAKAADFIAGTRIRVGFVSTNSITQGEQVAALWNFLFQRGIKIHFAYRTFAWQSEASGKAHVHVVIIGFGCFDVPAKTIYEPTDAAAGTITSFPAKNINGYLLGASDVAIDSRRKPISNVPVMVYGNKPTDGGNFFFTADERDSFLKKEPAAEKYIRRVLGADEYINNGERYCLWLVDCSPNELRSMPYVLERVRAVRKMRLESRKPDTRDSALTSTLFQEIRQTKGNYVIVPRHSSEHREYIPIGFVSSEIIVNDSVFIIPDASLYHFGILTSAMHNAWMRAVCGRLKSDYRYSAGIVYNNFVWPSDVPAKVREKTEKLAQKILDVRKKYIDGQNATLADLYDPLTMPGELLRAHRELDRDVDALYRKEPFSSERERVEFLFALYESAVAPLVPVPAKTLKRTGKE